MFFPAGVPVDASSMNWASVMFFGLLLGAAVHFGVRAHKTYFGPVVKVRGYVG
jgi:choline transport protein